MTRSSRKKQRRIISEEFNACGCRDNCAHLGLLEAVEDTQEVNAIGEWEELIFAVDSGATETVMNDQQVTSIPTVSGNKIKTKYRTANGEIIENEGEKDMLMCTSEGINRIIKAQVTEVRRPLMSVSKLVKAGNTVVFDQQGSYIYDKDTGETMSLQEDNGMYVLKSWVQKASGFHGFEGNP